MYIKEVRLGLRKLLKYMKEYKKEAFLSPFFKMVEAIFELFVPLVVAAIIDNGIGRADSSYGACRRGACKLADGTVFRG